MQARKSIKKQAEKHAKVQRRALQHRSSMEDVRSAETALVCDGKGLGVVSQQP